MQGEQPHQPWHYDLHVWMWEPTNRRGRTAIVKALQRPGRHRASAAKRGMRNGEASVRVLP